MINRASEGTCRQCCRRILWVRMKSGKNMPVDMALHNYKKDSTGKEKIVTPDGEVVTGRILVGERGDGAGYISHFASLNYELEQKHDLENFLTRQGVNHITGE